MKKFINVLIDFVINWIVDYLKHKVYIKRYTNGKCRYTYLNSLQLLSFFLKLKTTTKTNKKQFMVLNNRFLIINK